MGQLHSASALLVMPIPLLLFVSTWPPAPAVAADSSTRRTPSISNVSMDAENPALPRAQSEVGEIDALRDLQRAMN